LPAGTQTLHVVVGANGQLLNWIDFLATNGTPSVPDNLTASAGTGQVALAWSPSAGATGYRVKMSTTSGGPYTAIATPTTTGCTNSGLAAGVTYYYVVSATNTAGESSNSIQVSATTPGSSSSPPAAPAILTVTASSGQVSLTWSAVATATNYNVKRSATSGAETNLASMASTNYTDTSVVNGTKYYYVVSAVNSGGESPNSAEVNATPTASSSSSGTTALMNFADAGGSYFVPSPDASGHYWNNITSVANPGNAVSPLNGTNAPLALIDAVTGTATGWTLTVSNIGVGAYSDNFGGDAGTNNGPYAAALTNAFPVTALEDGIGIGNTGNPKISVTLSGLNRSSTYNVLLYGNSAAWDANMQTNTLAVGSSASPATVTFNAHNNTTTLAAWNNITPGAGGQIIFTVATSGSGALNAMEAALNAPATLGGIAPGALSGKSLTLNWTANANVHLQSATNLAPPVVWSDVPNTTGQGSANITTTNTHLFFRLIQP
jgi:hypothetical protein